MELILTGIIKHKKETMQVVKKYFLLVLLITGGCAAGLSLQEFLQGKFYLKWGYNAGEYGVSYQFDGNTFQEKGSGNLGSGHRARGTYHISGDTLILDYESLKDPDPTTYSFIERKIVSGLSNSDSVDKDSDRGDVRFQIVNKEDKPMAAGIVFLRNKRQEMVKAFMSDTAGRVQNISLSVKGLQDFKVNYLGKKPVVIPVDTLRGYHSKVKVTLSDSAITYSDYDGTKKYLIQEVEKNRIVLRRYKTREREVWIREGIEN